MKIRENHWMSISDIMSGLMIVFMFISVAFMAQMQSTVEEYAANKHDIYEDLNNEFGADLQKWNANIDEKTLAITFKDPDILFDKGSAQLTPEFQEVLSNFVPRYIKVLSQEKYKNVIEEIRIEGHTDPNWKGTNDRKTEYMNNMALSQARTRSVLAYVINIPDLQGQLEWMIKHITANGLSSSQPVRDEAGNVDDKLSRRVEFRVRTNADEKMNQLNQSYEKKAGNQ